MRILAVLGTACLVSSGVDAVPFALSSGFTSDMVLQRAPSKSAVYGTAPMSANISVEVSSTTTKYSVQATIISEESAFKAYLQPANAGGEYTVTVTCHDGCNTTEPTTLTLSRVTFGDVFFCSGQSNMALSLNYTFEAEKHTADVLSGKYSSLRFFQYGSMSKSFPADGPVYATTAGNVTWYNVSYAAGVTDPARGLGPFHSFSATCMNFGISLVDATDNSVPIGLIQSAIGGTRIEQWVDNSTFASCTQPDGTGTKLYYGMVAPFVNTSITGWLWYQGENNCGGATGSSATGVGYGCYQVALVSLWRRMWSVEPGTTNPTASFGLVTLASGGSEGHGQHMSYLRWSQTANYGVLPNEKMPNTYLAQGYDIGDPWAQAGSQNCSKPDPATGAFGPNCLPWDASNWDDALKPMYPYINSTDTRYFMGPIHPRIKHPVGRRLAVAYKNLMLQGENSFTGPTISGCSVSDNKLELRYNATLLKGEKLLLKDFNVTGWTDSNSMILCTLANPLANATTCACSGWNYVRLNDSKTFWYCEEGPGYKPPTDLKDSIPPLQWRPSSNPFNAIWQPAPLTQTGAMTLEVDLTKVNATGGVQAIRYGWNFGNDYCCADPRVAKGLLPCDPGACPVMTATTNLPGNPFFAHIEDNKCKCLPPQVCDN